MFGKESIGNLHVGSMEGTFRTIIEGHQLTQAVASSGELEGLKRVAWNGGGNLDDIVTTTTMMGGVRCS